MQQLQTFQAGGAGQTGQLQPQPNEPTLTDQVESLHTRLFETLTRLRIIGDKLVGPHPNLVAAVGTDASKPNTVVSFLRLKHSLISNIEAELCRLEARI